MKKIDNNGLNDVSGGAKIVSDMFMPEINEIRVTRDEYNDLVSKGFIKDGDKQISLTDEAVKYLEGLANEDDSVFHVDTGVVNLVRQLCFGADISVLGKIPVKIFTKDSYKG